MQTINMLPSDVITQIAAGEVIEKLQSIVKELVENSIDAKATKIRIELESKATDTIIVQDNGCGIEKDELINTVKKHYTSKIQTVDDLFSTDTLGFRGEALYSISSVSNLTIASNTDNKIGYYIELSNGELKKYVNEIGMPKGTLIIVDKIFDSIPVRKQYLKGLGSEISQITNLILKFILLYPTIKFSLLYNKKEILKSSGTGDSINDLIYIYGLNHAKEMLKVNYNSGEISINGYISNENYVKKNKRNQIIGVNGRIVSNKLLYDALELGSRKYLPPGLHSVANINIKIDNKKINKNIHPRKEKIQFLDETLICHHIESAISQTLEDYKWDSRPDISTRKIKHVSKIEKILERNNERLEEVISDKIENYKIIGQLHDTYIVVNLPFQTILMDQHAAHERIIYHKMKEEIENNSLIIKEFIDAPLIELSIQEELDFKQKIDTLHRLGFSFEHFGDRTYRIIKAPEFISEKQSISIISSSVQTPNINPEKYLEDMLISISCKSAIKANTRLNFEKMNELVNGVFQIGLTNCPHGRPIYIILELDEMQKRFKRKI